MEFSHFLSALTPLNFALALFGVVAGTVIGSIPGLTATMALAILVPITFSMEPASALILLGAWLAQSRCFFWLRLYRRSRWLLGLLSIFGCRFLDCL